MKKLFTVLFSLIMSFICLFSLSACKNNTVNNDSIINPREQTIKVGYIDYVPLNYSYRNSFMGFNTELALMTFEALGYNVQFKLIESSDEENFIPSAQDIYDALDDEYIDCFWGGLTDGVLFDNEKADFSYKYLENSLCIVNNTYVGTTISALEDFSGKTIAFAPNSTGELFYNSKLLNKVEGIGSYLCNRGQEEAMHSVKFLNQKADFAIVDKLMALYLTNNSNEYSGCVVNSSDSEEIIPYQFEEKYYCRAVFKKQYDEFDNPTQNTLRDNVNFILETFAKTGVLESLASKNKYKFNNEDLSIADFIIKDFSSQKS